MAHRTVQDIRSVMICNRKLFQGMFSLNARAKYDHRERELLLGEVAMNSL